MKRRKSSQSNRGSRIVVGRNAVAACLQAMRRRSHRLYLLEGSKGLGELEVLAGAQHVDVDLVTRHELDRLARGATHQGAVLETEPLTPVTPEDWLAEKPRAGCSVVALDSIHDPQNLGAIARSALAFDLSALVITRDRSAPLSPAAFKSAAGALEYLDVIEVTNLARTLELFKREGFRVMGLDAHAGASLWDTEFDGGVVFAVGGEGSGLRRLTREKCDTLIRIPASPPLPVLNASVSAAIVFAEWARRRLH